MADQYIADMFYRGVAPDMIEEMKFYRLKYYSKIHDLIGKTEADAVNGD